MIVAVVVAVTAVVVVAAVAVVVVALVAAVAVLVLASEAATHIAFVETAFAAVQRWLSWSRCFAY